MPTPRKGESQDDFVSRCISIVLDEGTAEDQKQAAAICYSMWRKSKKKKKKASAMALPSDVQIPGMIKAKAPKAEGKPATFKLVANTGTPMLLDNFFDPVIIDLTGAKFDRTVTPVIMDHDTGKRIGHTTSQVVEAKRIYAEGIVSSQMGVAQGFVEDSKAGFPFQVSVGASITEGEQIEPGDQTTVNGKQWKGPLIVARRSVIREISVTVLGGDNRTSAKVAAKLRNRGEGSMPADFQAYLKSLGLDPEKLTEEQKTKLEANYKEKIDLQAKVKSIPPPLPDSGKKKAEDPLEAQRKKAAAEEERLDEIRAVFRAHKDVEKVVVDGKEITTRTLKAKAISEGWSPEKVKLPLLEASVPKPTQFKGIHSRSLVPEVLAGALEVSLCRQLGIDEKVANHCLQKGSDFPDQVLEASHDRRFKHPTLTQVIDLTIEAAGLHYSGNRKDQGYMQTASRADQQIRAATQGFTTLAVSNILENLANKNLLAAYESQEAKWPRVAAVKSLNDFKAHSFYRLDLHGGYRKVNADGKLGHGTMTDARYQVRADTYGMIIALTRQDVINDDLNAFDQITSALGRQAAIAIEEAVFNLLLTNRATFDAVAVNKDLTIAGITEAEQIFRDKLDASKKPILVPPDRIVVGTQDAVQGQRLYAQDNLLASGDTDYRDFAENPHKGKYESVPTPYLNNTSIRMQDGSALANQDANQWFMLTNPAVLAAILVGFLQGNRTPVVESDDTAFDTLGIQYRSYHDWGVGAGDVNGAVWSPGA